MSYTVIVFKLLLNAMSKMELKYNDLTDLAQFYEKINLKKNDPMSLVGKIGEIYERAMENYDSGDDEQAYILLMRMLNVISYVVKSKDFREHQEYYKLMMGEKYQKGVQTAEELKKKLKKRYDEKCLKLQNKFINDKEVPVTDVDQKEATEIDMRNKIITKGFLTNAGLHTLLHDQEKSLCIIDIRREDNYKSNHISIPSSRSSNIFMCNIPEDLIISGLSTNRLSSMLSESTRNIWEKRRTVHHVILIDELSNEKEISSKLEIIKKIMVEYDPCTDEYLGDIIILSGGFLEWCSFYPWVTTGGAQPKQFDNHYDDLNNNLANIEYPNLDEWDPNVSNQITKPGSAPPVNRSTKKPALQNYQNLEEKRRKILQEQKDEANKSLEIEKQRLKLEESLHEDLKDKDQVVEDGKTTVDPVVLQKMEELKEEAKQKDRKIAELKEALESLSINQKTVSPAAIPEKVSESEKEIREVMEEKKELARKRKELENLEERKKFAEKNHEIINRKIQINVPPAINRSIKPVEKDRNIDGLRGKVGEGLTGLRNLGNTCYMNSILQCISNNLTLKKYFESSYRQHLNRNKKTRGLIAEEISFLLKYLWCGNYKYISCADFKNVVGSFKVDYRGYEQHDSHEFLTFLMDWLHEELLCVPSKQMHDLINDAELVNKEWGEFMRKNTSIISCYFFGQLRSTVTCYHCRSQSVTYEPFSDLSLTIPDCEGPVDLYDCLELYLKPEKILGWKCENCNSQIGALKKTEFCKLPRYLVIHLKRFSFHDIHSQKKTVYVNFPLENFRVKSEKDDNQYFLYGVSNHYGTMNGGHYTAFCKNPKSLGWYKFDDHEVMAINEELVISQAAYILFYSNIAGYSAPEL